MSFIRPEAKAALWRWREVIAGVALAVLGASWVTGPGGLLGWVGLALVAAGTALVVIGIQRARFRRTIGGPGIVQVDEGQITYFGPLTGGAAAVADLQSLALDPTAKPAHWVLVRRGEPPLTIPVNAEGSDALFDAFASLPGLRVQRMLAELNGNTPHPVVIWERSSDRPPRHRLH
ncbi:hypothetical protein LCL97_13220 [Seohaeicola saemankumensis]|nr:hypothetical protein [Seohaeicola saemankumensis]MCA0871792.1 hypothetical protein [Seohaeicola saemankumensis]